MELSQRSSVDSSTDGNEQLDGTKSDKQLHHHEGKLQYVPKTYSIDDLCHFSVNQEHTKHSYKSWKRKAKDSTHPRGISKWALTKSMINESLSYGMNGAERLLESVETDERWKDLFGALNHKLLKSIFCILFNETSTKMYHGEAFISDHLFGFFSYDQKRQRGLRICIAYADIQNITKAAKNYPGEVVKKRSLQKPHILPLVDISTKPSVIQIWSNAIELHQLYGFGPFFDEIYHLLYTSWKDFHATHT